MLSRRWLVIAAGALLAVAIIGGVVWRQRAPVNNLSSAPVGGAGARPSNPQPLEERLPEIYAVDKDFDGLSDKDEATFGTSPALADTDGDGLLDKDEIRIYKTNPIKADSDGDGWVDGYETRRGWNPLRSGKR